MKIRRIIFRDDSPILMPDGRAVHVWPRENGGQLNPIDVKITAEITKTSKGCDVIRLETSEAMPPYYKDGWCVDVPFANAKQVIYDLRPVVAEPVVERPRPRGAQA